MIQPIQSPPSDHASDDLAYLDLVATGLLARLHPIRCAVATTAAERDDVFRLRYRAVIDRGWAQPDDLPGGLERDPDDDRAVLVGAWDRTEPVAAARMIFPDPARRLPVESFFDIAVRPLGRVVNVDRITVDRRASDTSSRLLLGLIGRCWLEIRKRGFHILAGTDSAGVIRLYRRLGFEVRVLGPSRLHWGEERFPVRFDPTTGIRNRYKLL